MAPIGIMGTSSVTSEFSSLGPQKTTKLLSDASYSSPSPWKMEYLPDPLIKLSWLVDFLPLYSIPRQLVSQDLPSPWGLKELGKKRCQV